MNINKENTIGEVVALDYRAASIFEKNGIDFCCGGDKSIADTCKERNLNPDELINSIIETTKEKNTSTLDYNSWALDLLADYIEKQHHRYVQAKTQEITPYLDKIVGVHGNRHPELAQVSTLLKTTAGEMAVHMKKEELILFPSIRKLVKIKENGEPAPTNISKLYDTINSMMQDHDSEGAAFHQIAKLTNNYTVPEDGCNTYKLTLNLLKEFEADLHTHIHLENNILFPKSLKLAKEYTTD